ncbi:MAG: LamG domain-containing protein [Oligoflexia bacterium]|nr:LamG domain-containing protein [Oligoflexia bacterium]
MNGTTDRINISQSHTSTAAHTLELFVIVNNPAAYTYKPIVYFGYTGTSLYLQISGAGPYYFEFQLLGAACTGNPWVTSTTPIVAGQKYHIAWAHDGTWGAIFVNGVKELNQSSGGNGGCARTNTVIGGDAGGNYFPGIIDEVRLSSISRVTSPNTATTYPVPTVPYNMDANTVLLFHSEETGGFISNSSPSATFTKVGSPLLINSPFPL